MTDIENGIGTGIGLGIGLGVAGMVMNEMRDTRTRRPKKQSKKKSIFK